MHTMIFSTLLSESIVNLLPEPEIEKKVATIVLFTCLSSVFQLYDADPRTACQTTPSH